MIKHVADQGTISNLGLDGFKLLAIESLTLDRQPLYFDCPDLVLIDQFQETRVVDLFVLRSNIEILKNRQQNSSNNQPQ